ncbi:MAG: hypothetical protein LBR22_05010 [Desulfovibrio sp.]|jgi:hypothetical protein|nr:hypothetical protein [Desulfovibrio sp.]
MEIYGLNNYDSILFPLSTDATSGCTAEETEEERIARQSLLPKDTVTLSGKRPQETTTYSAQRLQNIATQTEQSLLTDEEAEQALAVSQSLIAESPAMALGAHTLDASRVYALLGL